MPQYKCRRCGYTSNLKANIRRHFQNKKLCFATLENIKICDFYEEVLGEKMPDILIYPHSYPQNIPLNTPKYPHSYPHTSSLYPQNIPIQNDTKNNICQYCEKNLSSYKNRWRHEKRCKDKAFTKEEITEKMADKDQIIADLKIQNANLLQKVGNTTNTTNNNTININLNGFGKEDLSYITGEFIQDLIRNNLFSAIPKLLKEIHFNPEHTENRNTLVPSRKDTLAKIYNGDKWDFTSKDDVFEDMTDKAFNKLTEYGSGPKFEKFYDAYDDQDTGYLKKIKKQTEIMILNNQ